MLQAQRHPPENAVFGREYLLCAPLAGQEVLELGEGGLGQLIAQGSPPAGLRQQVYEGPLRYWLRLCSRCCHTASMQPDLMCQGYNGMDPALLGVASTLSGIQDL